MNWNGLAKILSSDFRGTIPRICDLTKCAGPPPAHSQGRPQSAPRAGAVSLCAAAPLKKAAGIYALRLAGFENLLFLNVPSPRCAKRRV